MSTFEDRLLTELRQHVAANPAPATATPARRPRRGRFVLAGTGALAAVAAALVVMFGGGAAAYGVEKTSDGAVTVHIRSLADAAGLQRELRAAGVPAVVSYGAQQAPCGDPPPASLSGTMGGDIASSTSHAAGDTGPSTSQAGAPPAGDPPVQHLSTKISSSTGGVVFSIDSGTLRPGQHVYITTSTGTLESVGMAIC